MQNENDHIEDLFRRAAESYPLKTSGSNWDEVAAKLDVQNEKTDKPFLLFFNKYKVLTGLMLLLLAGLVGYLIYTNNVVTPKTKNIVAVNKNPEIISPNKAQSKSVDNSPAIMQPPVKDRQLPLTVSDKSTTATGRVLNQRKSIGSKGMIKAVIINSQPENIEEFNPATGKKLEYNFTSPFVDRYAIMPDNSLTIKEEAQSQKPANTISPQAKMQKKIIQKHWQLSLVAGLDKSNIKQQRYSKVGSSFGLTMGYSTKHWLVESGLIYDKKYYYSDGKYFNPKVAINSYWNIIDLEGNCNMFEIPFNVGYSVNVNFKSTLTFKGGVSSYLMNHEMYDYNYMSYGMVHSGTAKYKSSIKNWLAVTNLSMNYSHRLNKTTYVGMEPYIRIPVNNIGTGRMPISSSGINFSLSKKF